MVDFADNFSQYAKSKLPDFRDKFNGVSKWQQSGTSITVNSATDQVDWDFSRDNINKAISHDLGAVSDKNWVLRWKFIVNNFANISTSATGGWIGLFSDDHSVQSGTNQSFLTCFIRNASSGATQEIKMVQSDGTLNPENAGFDVEFTHTFPVATAEYYELKRESATSYRLSIYSDANYSDIIETQSFATSSAVNGLRYIKIAGFNESTVAQTFDGNIDDVEFWDAGVKPTFEENFSTYNNQAEADTAWIPNDSANIRVNPATGVLDWDIIMDGTNDAIALDLGVGNVDDNKFILRFTLNITTQTQASTGMAFNIGISDSDQTVSSTSSQDWIGFNYLNNNSFNGRWICAQSDNAQINGAGGNGTPVNELLPTATDIFFEIKRLSATSMEVNRYSDSTYTTIIGTSVHSAFSGTTGLRYIKVTNIDLSLDEGVGIGTIDNIKFYNGVTEVPTDSGGYVEGATTLEEDFTLRPADFLDDFSYASQGVADTAWVSTDVARLDPFPNELTWDIPVAGTTLEEAIYHDLGTPLSDSEWTIRFKMDIQAITSDNPVGVLFMFGLSDNIGIRTVNQDSVSIQYTIDSNVGDEEIRSTYSDNANASSNQTDIRTSVSVETQYVEITRTSTTSILINIYSDADYTVLTDSLTRTIPATITGLQYIKMYLAKPSGTNIVNGVVDDIEVYDGESVLSRWTSRAISTGVVNTKAKRIDWSMSRNGTDNRVVYDLGAGTVSDTNWLLKFRYHVNAGGVQALTSGANYQVLFQDTDVGQSATNDTIGFSMQNTAPPFGRTLVLLGRNGGSTSGFDDTVDNFIPFGGAFDLFVELRRVSATSVICNVYNDSDFSDLLTTLAITTSSGNISHRYLSCSSGNDATAWNGTETGFIDDIEFYNEQSVSKIPLKSKVPDFEDKFWEDNWTDTGAQHGVNTSTNVIDWDSARLAEAINQTTFDLETLFPEGVNPVKWGLRFKFKWDAVTAGGASSQFAVFLTSLPAGSSSEVAQDHATFKAQGNVPPIFAGMIDDGTQIYTGASAGMGSPLTFGGQIGYGEMTRNGTLFTWAIYSDPDYTQQIGLGKVSVNDNSVLAGLRYLKVGRRDGGAVVFTFNGTVEDIRFWNGSHPTEHGAKWVEVNIP